MASWLKPTAIASVFACMFFCLNCRSVYDQFIHPWSNTTNAKFVDYRDNHCIRGWPISCRVGFSSTPGNTINEQVCTLKLNSPIGLLGEWVTDSTTTTLLHGGLLTCNLFIGLILTAWFFSAVRSSAMKNFKRPQFSVQFLLLMMTCTAFCILIREEDGFIQIRNYGDLHRFHAWSNGIFGIVNFVATVVIDVALIMSVYCMSAKWLYRIVPGIQLQRTKP